MAQPETWTGASDRESGTPDGELESGTSRRSRGRAPATIGGKDRVAAAECDPESGTSRRSRARAEVTEWRRRRCRARGGGRSPAAADDWGGRGGDVLDRGCPARDLDGNERSGVGATGRRAGVGDERQLRSEEGADRRRAAGRRGRARGTLGRRGGRR